MSTISIVTPSFNQKNFLEQTIQSVLSQNYTDLEYMIIDGGSQDGSVDVIRKYAPQLKYWISEPDRGQYHAINKGFSHSTGEIMGWINSDDLYCSWTLATVAAIFRDLPDVDWITSSFLLNVDETGTVTGYEQTSGYARTWAYRGLHLAGMKTHKGFIQQESTFWRRSLWEKSGGYVDEKFSYVGDFELWLRFWEYADLACMLFPLAVFRVHREQKTENMDAYMEEANRAIEKYRHKVIRNPLVLGGAAILNKITGRGGRYFGSRRTTINYDKDHSRWNRYFDYVI